jgi:putative membrane protein
MTQQNKLSWQEAFKTSPGPQSWPAALMVAIKGICMGTAEIIPGVSGGTVALVTGIYEELLNAIKSINLNLVKSIIQFDLKTAMANVPVRFLGSLIIGMAAAVLSLVNLMHYLLDFHPVPTWGLFFGLIAASIMIVLKMVNRWSTIKIITFIIGLAIAHLIANAVPVNAPQTPLAVFICGIVAICAFILPGLSGSYVLFILGQYKYITGTLIHPFRLDSLIIIGTFGLGCLIGLLSFSRLLSYLLSRYREATLAMLAGLMAGSLQRIWPWKEIISEKIIHGRPVYEWGANVLPRGLTFETVLTIGIVLGSFFVIIGIEGLSKKTA